MIIKSKQLKSLFSFIAVIFMVCLTAISCKNKPTQAADFNIADPDVKPEPQPNNPAYDNKLIDYRTVKGADPLETKEKTYCWFMKTTANFIIKRV